jgi:hypothetical protein
MYLEISQPKRNSHKISFADLLSALILTTVSNQSAPKITCPEPQSYYKATCLVLSEIWTEKRVG